MKKSVYLEKIDDFLVYIANNSKNFKHSYKDKQSKKQWSTSGLLAAAEDADENDKGLTGYRWPFSCVAPNNDGNFERSKGKTLQESARTLERLNKYLKKNDHDDLCVFLACQSVLVWGGVWAGNDKRLYNHASGLAKKLVSLKEELKDHQSSDADDECLAKIIDEQFWMNSGSTKIFSILLPNFCIYDGRVGAALGLLVRRYLQEKGMQSVPELAFPWGVGKGENINASRRNPSDDKIKFSPLGRSSAEHAKWNIRANWLMDALARKLKIAGKDGVGPIRQLEAALFMIGYDVSGLVSENANGAVGTQVPKQVRRNKSSAASTRSERKKEETKIAHARRVYLANHELGRKQMLRKFVNECGLTEKGASTYYSNLKKEAHGSR